MMCKLGGDQLQCDSVPNGDGNISFVFSENSPLFQFFQPYSI